MPTLKKNLAKENISTEKVNTRNWIAVLAAILGVFMAILDVQITNASLKDILGTISDRFFINCFFRFSILLSFIFQKNIKYLNPFYQTKTLLCTRRKEGSYEKN
ncbi:hypothetical protein J3U21_10685 [Gilliamella sp. B2776]|uniref:hypothetical protein n=1 Tax=unclassified Gilliamella TaxID=2685620 RepID=UPI002269DDB1|nr:MULTISPECIES: hypothetical protein [unclassified Gilliamella]MCX8650769.1 hypothetical protein [Gilliamella sp. B2779]MCX8653867.1 hypothetical protein [Gilliamella sp. B2737]MCX8665698.1 hypothetical protein [Gilliamella sp. B2887]MCX8692617.1 hypothetical protein [Gilliamella sp. B2776]MCX8698544.1 hypothetical protein [Gilliamella sp. B3000]